MMTSPNHNHSPGHDPRSPKPHSTPTLVQPLRFALIAVYLPAFPLCIVHGALAHRAVPALGLLPLTASAATAALAFYLRKSLVELDEERRQRARDACEDRERTAGLHGDDDAHEDRRLLEGGDDDDTEPGTPATWLRAILTHPVTVFILDVVLATATMVVLVFTWLDYSWRSDMRMLSAYATVPLLASFVIHVLLALRALAHGLGLRGLLHWTAWRALPPNCPSCNVRLRPSSFPELPWLKFFQQSRSQKPSQSLGRGTRRGAGRRGYVHVPVVVDERDRYRDEVGSVTGGDNTPAEENVGAEGAQPDAVNVSGKDSKGKGTDGNSPWST